MSTWAEIDDTRRLAALRFDMGTARPMTGFALQSAMPKRTPRIIRSGMCRAEQAHDGGIVMAVQAGVSALGAV
jgi:hypothetical protein